MGRSINPNVFLQVVHHIGSEPVVQGIRHAYEDASPELRVHRPATGAVSGSLECQVCGEIVPYTVKSAATTRLRRRMWVALGCLAATVLVATAMSVVPLVNQTTGSPDPGPAFAVIGLLIGGFAFGLFGGVLFVVAWIGELGVRGPGPLPFLRYGANDHALKYYEKEGGG
jgi:hypothetical protein